MRVTVDVAALTAAARAETERHAPRTPERRTASHLWVACITASSPDLAAVRRAVKSFGAHETQAAATELLHRLAEQVTP